MVRCARNNIVGIGRCLAEVHERIEHGAWLDWLKTEFSWSDQTARNFIHVYRASCDPNSKRVLDLDLPLRVIYEFVAPKAGAIRAEVTERIVAGEALSAAMVCEVIDQAKAEAASAKVAHDAVQGGEDDEGTKKHRAAMAALAAESEPVSIEIPNLVVAVKGAPAVSVPPAASIGAVKSETGLTVADINKALMALTGEQLFEALHRHISRLTHKQLCQAMSKEQKAEVRDCIIGQALTKASTHTEFAVHSSGRLHVMLSCAEKKNLSDENRGKMIAAGRAIIRDAERRGIARSDILITEGKAKRRGKGK
jgi:hypothetical protein